MSMWIASILTIVTLPFFVFFGGWVGFFIWLALVLVSHFAVENRKKSKLEDERHKELLEATKIKSQE